MEIFKWSDDYSVQIDLFDGQHKELVKMINDLLILMKNKEADSKIKEIIERMDKYAKFHFASEEKYMRLYKYPQMPQHIEVHQKFIEKIQDVRNKMQTSSFLISMDVYYFLKNWLIDHIQGMDKEYSSFFTSHGLNKNVNKNDISRLKEDIDKGFLIKFD